MLQEPWMEADKTVQITVIEEKHVKVSLPPTSPINWLRLTMKSVLGKLHSKRAGVNLLYKGTL